MELREPINDINKKLLQEYGTEFGNAPRYRVVFSEDQYEKRFTNYTDEGLELQNAEVRLLPKYRQYVRAKYILEVLVPIPENAETDLVSKISYEPLWVFQDGQGNYLPPFFEGCQLIIESRYAAMGRKGCFAKYHDNNSTPEEREAHLKKVEQDLFGNETDIGDALAYGSGVGFTTSKLFQ